MASRVRTTPYVIVGPSYPTLMSKFVRYRTKCFHTVLKYSRSSQGMFVLPFLLESTVCHRRFDLSSLRSFSRYRTVTQEFVKLGWSTAVNRYVPLPLMSCKMKDPRGHAKVFKLTNINQVNFLDIVLQLLFIRVPWKDTGTGSAWISVRCSLFRCLGSRRDSVRAKSLTSTSNTRDPPSLLPDIVPVIWLR